MCLLDLPYIVSKRLAVVWVGWPKILPNFDIHIALDSHYKAVPVAIVVVKQTSGTGVMEHFLDVLRECHVIFCDVLQSDCTVIEATGSRTRVGIEARI